MPYRRAQTTSRDNHRAWFIRQGWSRVREHCPRCDERIQMVTLDEAAFARRVDLQTIHTLVEAGDLHAIETNEGQLWICLNSLTK